MVTRDARTAAFNTGAPPEGTSAELLCEDHCGTYAIPFVCTFSEGVWRAASSGSVISATVIGWRAR